MNVLEIIKESTSPIVTADFITCLVGLTLLACWLLQTSFGRKALADSVPRRNNMPPYLPFVPLLFWSGLGMVSMLEESWADGTLSGWQKVSAANVLSCMGTMGAIGILVLLSSLVRTRWSRHSLAESTHSREHIPVYLPFVLTLIWFAAVSFPTSIVKEAMADLPDWQGVFLDNLILCTGAIATVVLIILLARATFARRLKGFGLNVKTVHKDFFAAFVNLLTVWPLMMAALALTMFFGELIWGTEYRMQQHQQLQLITEYSNWPLRIMIVVVAVIVVPVLEEVLFRGLFQTVIRSFLAKPWPSIVISSAFFAWHHQAGHFPALFVLALCLGYAYEKSGSLFRPIFIHSLFNASSIIAALYQ